MLEVGTYRSASDIAEAENIDCSFVNQLLQPTLLPPDIAEAIMDGRQPKGMLRVELTGTMPSAWEEEWSELLHGSVAGQVG